MKRITVFVALIAALITNANAQQGKTTLLPPSATAEIRRLQWIEGNVGGYWFPTPQQMATLEKKLPEIARLSVESGVKGAHIMNPAKDNRQYVALSVNGRRAIFIHAFCGTVSSSWTSHLEIIMDGGTCVWEVLYDIDSQSFSHLTTNGIG